MSDIDLRSVVRAIPDYPKAGIMFRDVTTLFGDPAAFAQSVDQLADRLAGTPLDKIAGVEARGFILGGALAVKMGLGFVPIRKRGKLPWKAISQDYELEYGVDQVEIHEDAVAPGERVAVVDDLIATGGTAFAGVKLVERLEGVVEDCAFIIDLPELGGADRLRDAGKRVHCLIAFDGH